MMTLKRLTATLFTPAKVKADILFIASLVAVFGFNIPAAVSVALIASAGLIAAALNLGDSLIQKYDPQLIADVRRVLASIEKDATGVLPLILPLLESLPGKIGQEVAEAIKKFEAEKAAPKTKAKA
jgi:hypothetical protein